MLVGGLGWLLGLRVWLGVFFGGCGLGFQVLGWGVEVWVVVFMVFRSGFRVVVWSCGYCAGLCMVCVVVWGL